MYLCRECPVPFRQATDMAPSFLGDTEPSELQVTHDGNRVTDTLAVDTYYATVAIYGFCIGRRRGARQSLDWARGEVEYARPLLDGLVEVL